MEKWKKVIDELPLNNLRCKIKIIITTIDDEVSMKVDALYKIIDNSFTFLLGESKVEIHGKGKRFKEKENLFNQRLERQLVEITHWLDEFNNK